MEKLQILKKNLNSQKKIRKPLDGFVKSSAPYVLPLQ